MDEKQKVETIEIREITKLAKVASVIIATLTLMAGGFSWLSHEFLRKESFVVYQQSITDQSIRLEEKIAEVIRVIEEDRARTENEIRQLIRDGSAIGIIIRRDFLLSRDKDSLTPAERAELTFLTSKLKQFNLE